MIKYKKYRVVRDTYSGFECQIWRWYWPFWVSMGFTNTHKTLDNAIKYIESHKTPLYES